MILFLFQSNILIPDRSIFVILTKQKYKSFLNDFYFYKELNQFYVSNDKYEKCSAFQNNILYEQKRQIGENDNYICQLIKNDSVNEFISYSNKNNLSLDSEIIPSIYETNQFLIQNKTNLINYSAFFGSIKIFKYLFQKKVKVSSASMLYAIHGNNCEIIHLIEDKLENKISDEYHFNWYIESIKCHHNELALYFSNKCSNDITQPSMKYYLEYYNFEFLQISDNINQMNLFNDLCIYDYFIPAQILIKNINLSKEKLVLPKSVKRGNVDIVKLLLENPQIDVNFKKFGKKEKSALIVAIKNEHYEIVKLLLNHPKININQKYIIKIRFGCKIEKPALSFAIMNNNINIAQLLIQRKEIKINDETNISNMNEKFEEEELKMSILNEAVKYNSVEIVKLLLKHQKIDVNKKVIVQKGKDLSLMPPLYTAILQNQNEIATLLINHKKIDINDFSFICKENKSKKDTALCLAIKNQNIEIIQLLVSKPKIQINKRSKWTEVNTNKIGFIQKRVKNKKSPLLLAIETGNADIVKILLNCSKIDVNDKNIFYCRKNNMIKLSLYLLFLLSMVILALVSFYYADKKLGDIAKVGLALSTLIH